ncbi:unnamed protein product [Ixodes hexagonus]
MSGRAECVACLAGIADEQKFMSCSVCRNGYHLGQACAGITETSYTGMGQAKRDKWRCKTCRTQENRSGSQSGANSSLNASSANPSAVEDQMQSFGQKLDLLLAMKTSIDSLLSLPAKVDELLTLKPTVERLEVSLQEMDNKVDGLTANYNSVLECATENKTKISDLGKQHGELSATVKDQAETIQALQEQINNSEQYGRLVNLEIHGLPKTAEENLKRILSDLAIKLGISNFKDSDIQAAHRLPAKTGSIPIVLVKFSSRELKDCWLHARGRLRDLEQTADAPKLFFNENLTRQNRELFWMVRERAKQNQYKFTWVKNGKIFVKKSENSPVLRINRVADLDAVV